MQAGPTSLVELLRTSVIRHPDRVAICHREATLSYRDLWARILAVSRALQADGLRPGDRVALLLENSAEYVAAYYGVLHAGGVVVSLGSTLRDRELVRNITHCGAVFLVTMADHAGLPAVLAGCPQLRLVVAVADAGHPPPVGARDWTAWLGDASQSGETSADTPAQVEAREAAAILYTSGTTGDPRGVTLSHRNLVANTRSILAYLQLTEADRIVNVLPFHYAYGNSILHTHLASGAAISIENSLSYPHLVVQAMVEQRATGFAGVPSTFSLLLRRVNMADYDLSSLRYLTQAGGAMPPAVVRRLRSVLPEARLFIMYGQTEATARICYLPPDRLDDKPGSVGIPVPGVAVEIHDAADVPVAPETEGEVCVRGDNVMLGYWNNPEATAAVLRNGWLHTGDIGRMDGEGFLTLAGRSAEMIKTGAHRVSPQEIEEAVLELEGVAECAAVGIPDEILGEVIRVLVVAGSGEAITPRVVQAHCRHRLAAHKIPKDVVIVSSLPRTVSGKVRRFMLKEMIP